MLLAIGGIKGGSGKTTLATNLCEIRSHQGRKVLLVDADEQKSASDWYDQRAESKIPTSFTTICLSGKTMHLTLDKLIKDYDDIIVDVGGRNTTSQRSTLMSADVFLVPFKPRSIDLWTIGQVQDIINECTNPNLKSYFVINQADHSGTDNSETLDVLKECAEFTCLPGFIGSRKAFSNAAARGLSVRELSPRDEKALSEIMDLCNEIYS
jgi:chromosome partitioning protein